MSGVDCLFDFNRQWKLFCLSQSLHIYSLSDWNLFAKVFQNAETNLNVATMLFPLDTYIIAMVWQQFSVSLQHIAGSLLKSRPRP